MNLSELSNYEADIILRDIKETKPTVQSAQRDLEYMFRRRMYEDIIKKEFIKKGGSIKRDVIWWLSIAHGRERMIGKNTEGSFILMTKFWI